MSSTLDRMISFILVSVAERVRTRRVCMVCEEHERLERLPNASVDKLER